MIGWERADNFPNTEVLSVIQVKVSIHQQKDVQIDLKRDQIQNHLTEGSLSYTESNMSPLFNIAVSN